MKTLYLCGVGNGEGIRLALTVNRACSRWHRIVLLDDDPAKHGTVRMGLEVAGPFSDLAKADPGGSEVVNLVTRTTDGRASVQRKIAGYGVPFTALIHPGVDLFGTDVAADVTIYQNASIGAEASIGASSVVLIGAVVGHGARIGQGCVIAPNAVINARVTIADRSYVGSNASVLPDLNVGAGATIGANSLVYADVPPGATAMGVPAQILGTMPVQAFSDAAGIGVDLFGDADHPMTGVAGAGRADAEAAIAQALMQVLGVDKVDGNSNFFDLGCTSLKALALSQHLRGIFGGKPQIVDVYRFPTVRTLASFLAGGDPGMLDMRQTQQRADLRRQLRLRR